jgi:hypothetical protein
MSFSANRYPLRRDILVAGGSNRRSGHPATIAVDHRSARCAGKSRLRRRDRPTGLQHDAAAAASAAATPTFLILLSLARFVWAVLASTGVSG